MQNIKKFIIIHIISRLKIGILKIIELALWVILLIRGTIPTLLDLGIELCKKKEECLIKKNNKRGSACIYEGKLIG